jgi:hypothetical protein
VYLGRIPLEPRRKRLGHHAAFIRIEPLAAAEIVAAVVLREPVGPANGSAAAEFGSAGAIDFLTRAAAPPDSALSIISSSSTPAETRAEGLVHGRAIEKGIALPTAVRDADRLEVGGQLANERRCVAFRGCTRSKGLFYHPGSRMICDRGIRSRLLTIMGTVFWLVDLRRTFRYRKRHAMVEAGPPFDASLLPHLELERNHRHGIRRGRSRAGRVEASWPH